MQTRIILRAGALSLAAVLLASCEEGASLGGESSFRAQYLSAREALEDGQYDRAARGYARLLTRAGPLEPRIRLEYAHALLRNDQFAEAAREAGTIAQGASGPLRHAALSVRATAEHELALQALQNGDRATAKQLMLRADEAIGEVLKTAPDLDPLGALAGRQASIRVRVKAL